MIVVDAANALVRTLLAPRCAGCERTLDRPLSGTVCEECWRSVRAMTPPLCATCGDALSGEGFGVQRSDRDAETLTCPRCARDPPSFARARSAARYDGPFRQVIHVFKYERRRPLARPIAALMAVAGADVLADADAVIPVPLHPWRAFTRGFNQADDLALHLGLPVWRALRRTKRGPPQARSTAGERERNLVDAFAVGPAFGLLAPWWRARLAGRTVVLIDDVMTTGATLEACSVVLAAAGVRSVRALTAARAVAARPVRPPGPPRRATARR